MAQIFNFTDSSIVMAEQSGCDVVDQTLSGGEPTPSDVPVSTTDTTSAGGDAGETKRIATNSETHALSEQHSDNMTKDNTESQGERTGSDKEAGTMVRATGKTEGINQLNDVQDTSKQSVGLVASRALELNGVTSGSDAGDDTASQGGSESDTSRTDARHHAGSGSVKKPPTFKAVSFTKFAVPKAPGVPAPPKAPEKSIALPLLFAELYLTKDITSTFYLYHPSRNTTT